MIRQVFAAASAVCSVASFALARLAWEYRDGGVYLFSAFGILFGFAFLSAIIPVLSGRFPRFIKIKNRLSPDHGPVSFVSHRFLIGAIAATLIAVLAAILFPVLFR
jgi:hypothetical protein